jgi:CRISPR/Cas system CSM-associated protein Csm2 small subunit
MPFKNLTSEIKKQETECSRLRKIYDFAKHGSAREVAAANWQEARNMLQEMRIQNGETKFK